MSTERALKQLAEIEAEARSGRAIRGISST